MYFVIPSSIFYAKSYKVTILDLKMFLTDMLIYFKTKSNVCTNNFSNTFNRIVEQATKSKS